MFAKEVKTLFEKRMERKIVLSEGAVSAIAEVRPNDDDMEITLFAGGFVVLFDKVEVTDTYGLDLYFRGNCVAAVDVREWRLC